MRAIALVTRDGFIGRNTLNSWLHLPYFIDRVSFFHEKGSKYGALIEPAQEHCRALCDSYILQAEVEMQGIHVMFDTCSHNHRSHYQRIFQASQADS